MRKILALTAIVGVMLSSSVFAVSPSFEDKLLERALIEGAVTGGQKAAVQKYLVAIAEQKRERAQELRELAHKARGGKYIYQVAQTRKLMSEAKELEKEAQAYENYLANLKLENGSKELAQN